MTEVTIEGPLQNGKPIRATFLPLQGMNMISYKKGDVEIIDQSTRPLFDERYAGLGPVIGPHFHRQRDDLIATGFDESLFPHIARVKANGTRDPFSHGIARYAPWNFTSTESEIHAKICGDDVWHGFHLKELEGADFKMEYTASLKSGMLKITLQVECQERPCIAGLHTYYALGGNKGFVTSHVCDEYNVGGEFKKIPEKFFNRAHSHIKLSMDDELDFGFLPIDKTHGRTLLETPSRSLSIRYESKNKDLSCQIYHPAGGSFVCIEPLSAKNPRNLDKYLGWVKISIELL